MAYQKWLRLGMSESSLLLDLMTSAMVSISPTSTPFKSNRQEEQYIDSAKRQLLFSHGWGKRKRFLIFYFFGTGRRLMQPYPALVGE